MAFLTALGLAGENVLAQSHARAKGASPKPSAAQNKTAKEKYGFEAILEIKSFLFNVADLGCVLAKELGCGKAVRTHFLAVHPTL